jgi:hypothetical protein
MFSDVQTKSQRDLRDLTLKYSEKAEPMPWQKDTRF